MQLLRDKWPGTLRPIVFLLLLAMPTTLCFAQGVIDVSNITNQASAFLVALQFIGAIAAVACLIFAGLAIRGRNIGEGLISFLCAVLAVLILANAKGWVTSITGVQI